LRRSQSITIFVGVDGIVVDLHFDDFAALVDQVAEAASLPTVLR
jgi:hypothetical protein